jgi:DNA/RNA-binding domain of Phe-tRNA-synthetase-like protein
VNSDQRDVELTSTAAGGESTAGLIVDDGVCAAFGGMRIDAIVADGFSGRSPWPEVDDRLSSLEAAMAAGTSAGTSPVAEDDPHVQAWRMAYRAFGTNPKRERPSVDALRRPLARSGRLPRINPAVDCYNLISVTPRVLSTCGG